MIALIGDFTRFVGLRALRLFQLNLLWLAGVVCGGIVLGVGPATAAVAAVVRRDRLWGIESERGPRERVTSEFATAWRREFWSANRLAFALALMWSVVVVDLLVVRLAPGDGWAALSRGVLIVLAIVLASITALAWSMHANFDDSTLSTLRRCLVFAVGRPLWGLAHSAALIVVLAAYVWMPGLAVVFGIALPCAASLLVIGVSGVVPVPDGAYDVSLRARREKREAVVVR